MMVSTLTYAGPVVKPARFTSEEILDAAAQAVHTHWRSATVAHVTALLGAPSGSIYHRFASRDALFASAWVRAVGRFHAQFDDIREISDPVEAIVETGMLIPTFCRANPVDARMLTVYRHRDLVAAPPAGLEDVLPDLNAPVGGLIAHLAERRYGQVSRRSLEVTALAARDTPLGMVRTLLGEPIPIWLDNPIRAAIRAVAELDLPH
ncbi:putative transcriptional regulator, TetR family protein [Nocardioides luteus]|uniref:Transcriptional regulator, TetR family protein n=1 Tax=Nocardioides luteus TaxID=1844 RepID=A0ABQ5SY15_9ACTN|nr:putative transcriptional regulator, TetR family protein [Nocardioides luteus]GLJ68889.1 putative transcriptional regulator, TetR family protein [Nocardioides luteus]